MKPFYVWQDHLLEELFAMEKADMDENYPKLKETLEKEKVVFIEIMAEGMKDACNKYRDLQDELREQIPEDIDSPTQTEEELPQSIKNSLSNSKRTLH